MATRTGKRGLAAKIKALLAADDMPADAEEDPAKKPEEAADPADKEDEEEGPETPGEAPDPEDEEEDPEPADPKKAGALAERKRIAGIVGSTHAKGRGKLASTLAFETSMSVAEAEVLMKSAATENTGALAAHMANLPNASVGAGGGDAAGTADETTKTVASIIHTHRQLTGRKPAAA